ncbi:hypothetical protein KX75_20215 [Salmonella enterica subsp. enterica]|nr:hypothetical protein [Salmonella enterica subsp. enterica serovar Mikawasima]EDN7229198.1 hypothetical protein [Salmonella enterica subsp. enterica serovar Mikawasima]
MSWDNVAGVSEFNIWTESNSSSEGDEAFLYVNSRHQVKITVGLSVALVDSTISGPTDNEVRAALTLVNNKDGGALKHLVQGEKGDYTTIYDPGKVTVTPGVKDSDYQYEIEFYLSSNSTVNSDNASEEVSVKLTYTDASGYVYVDDLSEQGEYYEKDFVKVTCYAPKKYTTSDFTLTKETVSATWHQTASSSWTNYDTYLYRFRMSCDYYLLENMSLNNPSSTVLGQSGDFCLGFKTEKTSSLQWDSVSDCYGTTDVYGMGKKSYSATLYDDQNYSDGYSPSSVNDGYHTVNINQGANEFIFTSTYVTEKQSIGSYHYTGYRSYDAYDQFGNYIAVTMLIESDDNRVIPSVNNIE